MKSIIIIVLMLTAGVSCLLTGCGKSSELNIFQKWQVVNDSTFSSAGLTQNYTGKAGDYFDFKLNDILYIKEDSLSDTVPFFLISAKSISFTGLDKNNDSNATITAGYSITADKLVITLHSSNAIIGSYSRIINLKK